MPRMTISCAGTRVMSSPANMTVPALAGVRPEIERRVVVLPAPLEPISVTTSPSSTVSETPFQRLDRAVVGVEVGDLEQRHQSCFPR